ncbi:MAG: ATPase [Alphaproteobacteria bacterium]|nr:ATPase [Alphaproteobacteria bacterium]
MSITLPNAPAKRPRVIVLGNEKGGSGKSTAAMHLIVGLLHAGRRVGSMDVDSRQATLSRYLDNRRATIAGKGVTLPMPDHRRVDLSAQRGEAADADERVRFEAALAELSAQHEVVVIDTPGSDTFLSRLAHSHADTIVTPMNDSFVDMDLIAKVDPDTLKVLKPSLYAVMVWEQRKQRALRDRSSIDWIVMRNRLASIEARNKRAVGQVLEQLSRRIGFRLAPGFGDRVIFRELFLQGLTLLDLGQKGLGVAMSMSHVAARQEVRDLLKAVGMQAEVVESSGEAVTQDLPLEA